MAKMNLDEVINAYKEFLMNAGLKKESIPIYTTPIKKLLQRFEEKTGKVLFDETDLADFIYLLHNDPELLKYMHQELSKYNILKATLERFSNFVTYLNTISLSSAASEEGKSKYKIYSAKLRNIEATDIKWNNAGWLEVTTIQGKKVILNPDLIDMIKET